VLVLEPAIQYYAWGDPDYIPALLGKENREQKPHAELWLGAHKDGPAMAGMQTEPMPLDRLIARSPAKILGCAVTDAFHGQLPFLLKVLSAAAPLSIQVHPGRSSAEAGFERENRTGIPINAGHRNYRDTNHKPELIVALTEFYAVSGFRSARQIRQVFQALPELRNHGDELESGPDGLRKIYSGLMTLAQDQVDQLLGSLLDRLAKQNSVHPFTKDQCEYWILKSDRIFSASGHRDRGLFSLYLLNLVHLKPGEGLYLPDGILHAYLEGSGVEVMANSNNVIRGGLTPKHVDVPELLNNVSFEELRPEILSPSAQPRSREAVYPTPAREFELSRIDLDRGMPYQGGADHSVEILIVVSDAGGNGITVDSNGQSWKIRRGSSFLVRAGAPYVLEANGPARLFKATVPSVAAP
jgi:mannose-6-phosphate isomerase class I